MLHCILTKLRTHSNSFVLFLLLIASLQGKAQGAKGVFNKDPLINLENFDKQRVYWGYYLGLNFYDYKIDYIKDGPDILVNRTGGFNVGLVGDLKLTEYLSLRFEPGLYYTQRNLEYSGFTKAIDAKREIPATFLHFPLLLKFLSVRTGNIRPYLLGGFSASMNLASNSNSKDDNAQQKFRVKPWTRNYEVGFGMDLYLEYFKFSPSIRGVFGLNDELIRDNDPNSPWTGNIKSLKTRAVFVNFTFH